MSDAEGSGQLYHDLLLGATLGWQFCVPSCMRAAWDLATVRDVTPSQPILRPRHTEPVIERIRPGWKSNRDGRLMRCHQVRLDSMIWTTHVLEDIANLTTGRPLPRSHF